MPSNTQTLSAIKAAGLTVSQQLTRFNFTNADNINRIKYIVVHYVGATGGAKNNADFYGAAYRGASAHYFVGFQGEIVQVVSDDDIAWHCGTKNGYKHPHCRNSNSVGIEMCVHNRNGSVSRTDKNAGWYFDPETIKATQRLVRVLMKQYNVPIENVVRHYDVTGKMCPAPYCNGQLDWAEFKRGCLDDSAPTHQEEDDTMTNEKFAEMMDTYLVNLAKQDGSAWSADARSWAEDAGLIKGDQNDNPQWKSLLTREQLAVILQRYSEM